MEIVLTHQTTHIEWSAFVNRIGQERHLVLNEMEEFFKLIFYCYHRKVISYDSYPMTNRKSKSWSI